MGLTVEEEFLPDLMLTPACYHAQMFPDFGVQVPMCYAAKKTKNQHPDIFNFDECMRSLDRAEWMEAMLVEIRALEKHGAWTEVDMDEPLSLGIKVIPSQWTMRNKRNPAGEITKKKGRIVFRGDLEPVAEDENNASPVVSWTTIRVLLVLSITQGWETVTADFANAFIQSHTKKPMCMSIPRGFKGKFPGARCLKLLRNLYGARCSPREWFLYLTGILKKIGLKQSENDPCLWCKEGLIVVLFTDDVIASSRTPEIREQFIADIEKAGLVLTVESSLTEYLGIQFDRNDKDGTVTMTQPGLIKKVLQAANMSDCSPNKTPAKQEALGIDPDGEPMDEPWNYASIVGMLLYLCSNTRPDLSYSVSQAARFTHSPKKSHAQAVKHLLRYLKGTMDLGITVSVGSALRFDVYSDADFCGRYKVDPVEDPTSAKSRMGYIVYLASFPLFWKSKLISCICLSTAEAEYTALSNCLRDFIPVHRVTLELATVVGITEGIPTTIYEDNDAARLLANNRYITSRTKYYLVKYHHFWSFMEENKEGKHPVSIERVDTTLQDADFFTKQLPVEAFVQNRQRVQGA